MYTFKKEERLCNKKLIDELFHNGSSFLCYPYRVTWLTVEDHIEFPVQVLIAVPKKRYKLAVDRNLVKRRIREAYRLNKQEHLYNLIGSLQKKIVFSVGYVGKEIEPYPVMVKKMLKLLKQLGEQVTAL